MVKIGKFKINYKTLITIIVMVVMFTYAFITSDSLSDIQKTVKESNNDVALEVSGNLKVYFIDVGQADSILITNNDESVLIDSGNNNDGEKLVNYIKGLGITKFNYVIGTHAHEDHIGGMDNIINNFDIDTFYMPNAVTTTNTFEDVLNALENKNIKFETPGVDDEFKLSDAIFNVLYTGENQSDLNSTSIVLKLTFGENKILFMGDAPIMVENKIMDKDIKADVLKVGHHGSEYSTGKDFLNEVKPEYAVISVGTNNVYEHPKDITLDRLNEMDIEIYRTDLDGTIILNSDGTNITFTTVKTDTNGG